MPGVLLEKDFAARLYRVLPWLERMYRNPAVAHLPGASILPRDCQLFELKTNIAPGGTADAWNVLYDGTTDTDTVIQVIDVQHRFRARGRDDFASGSDRGAFGWYVPGKDPRQIVTMQAISQKILISISGCHDPGAQLTPTAVEIMDPGGQDGTHAYPVYNYDKLIGSQTAGSPPTPNTTSGILCVWDEAAVRYIVVKAPAASCAGGSSCAYPVGAPESSYPNYTASQAQFLGHDANGCWLWIDYTSC
jgi:hypothetical protein